MTQKTEIASTKQLSFEDFKNDVLNDYRIARLSRECSLLGRREVLTGKAKFGIFGDGKEVPQLAMAKAFKNGDFRSGYYRDQTFMMAINELTPQQFFAGLYGHNSIEVEPMSAGRQMGGHFATHSLDENGKWKNLTAQKNSSSDISPTAGQMPRLLGLAQASKIYRNVKGLEHFTDFSDKGNEVAWGTIGNASTSEGLFFETINAAGVLQVPMVMNVWDDEYGISVHAKYQTTKESISEILKGFQKENDTNGYEIFVVNGWDYVQLIDIYNKAGKIAREQHIPVLIHVKELTQPQGHSTSGSHERYKSTERLQWEQDFDCISQMRKWILEFELKDENGAILKFVNSEEELMDIEKQAKKQVSKAKRDAWSAYTNEIKAEVAMAVSLLETVAEKSNNGSFITKYKNDLASVVEPIRKDILVATRKSLRYLKDEDFAEKKILQKFIKDAIDNAAVKFSSHLLSETTFSPEKIAAEAPKYAAKENLVDARLIMRDNFDAIFKKYPEALIFGEDAGYIGDVNQGLEGLQEKYGELRVSDTGIREATILGQGIGMAMRGLRPIAEIQYLDYLLYALQIMSDDLATLRYRTFGKQKAPLIIRTRGHRLEGIWHSGSPMGGIINNIRGIHVLVPRNMTKAAGFYNTLLQGDDPALVIECLNGYRLKEELPINLGDFKTPIGVVETIKEGTDMTVISYGSTLRIVEEAAKELAQVGIDIEIIDAQSLLPFDINHDTVKSVAKTNRLLVVDEDLPGGASAYLLQEIVENQNGYKHLDSKPQTLTAKAHRPAYGTDGDYFSKPSAEDIFEKIYAIMNEANPSKYKSLY
ncbi:alpha-ketoacid dehydrogenase subunit alpha/beta [Tenacibaculum finnmarkense]|uniref:3-methyl-2-oxobutanoate dehydrogenase (2-methylpropanoyl-transferring) n=1 Tax=Tenacibaculum finnmarkense genomovar finnmarkense TaxID=1458503 RepID=A0AAP1RE15_9FLAO|nr:alpha-ketoacid dehydrogenase subunit alpha/beta [Tenacibaculum finnmarkense]MBE7652248.1 transketolase [Tenacibaculum finnmarkense genomovar finnmarkense]MBE7694580.1 transketolase [Tenacibaculum finnmarkense genomovar finnmarkense]MCD8426767.1 transketolase [Tenacibaculum finnmarkense genomovar finnmarkense]MCG8730553.1 transketolase [Tenacibaculum finnmarkense]MCG8750940.1 transketolase [Tenacibaculum finnmarkense]